MYKKGFTLIELLVVISIISLLSTVVLASLTSAKEKARIAAGMQFAAYTYHAVGDQALGMWSFDENSAVTAQDSSGSNRTGIMRNGPTISSDTPSGRGYSLSLNGLNNYLEIPYSSDLNYVGGDLTLSIWVKPNSTETNIGRLISKPWNGSGAYNYVLLLGSDLKLSFSILGSSSYTLATTYALPVDKWSNIVATVDGATKKVKIYVDGVERASGTHSIDWSLSNPANGSVALAIGTLYPYGTWAGDTSHAFAGLIDDPRVYTESIISQ